MVSIPSAPSRSDLSAPGVRLLHRGGRTKADLLLVPFRPAPVVVKDFARKAGWVRLWGRLQIRREAATYELLRGVPGLAVFHGRVDGHALAMEYLEGKRLDQCRGRDQRRRYFEDLSRTMQALHRRGILHNDLRGKDNALVTHDDDRVVLLDLAGALRLRPGGWLHRLLFPLLARVDRAALLKWKVLLVPEDVTDEERAFLRRFRRWRRLWMFNLKGYAPGKKTAP
jgi:serine/threonine protein kinase